MVMSIRKKNKNENYERKCGEGSVAKVLAA